MQALSDCIKEIRNDRSFSTWNEAQAKEWIIRPILDLLGWGRREITPEYGVGTRRVDYALEINGDNEVFIEAKKPGEDLENHQKQLLDYSFGEGVDLAILTNGIAWWFYLPLQKGPWNDRKFYTIDIFEQGIEDIVDKFDLLLSRQNVASGKAVRHAEFILESSQRDKIVKERLPEAWNRVIDSPDSLLVDLLAETAAEMGDFRPTDDEILRFMRSHHEKWFLSPESEQGVPPPKIKDTARESVKQTLESADIQHRAVILIVNRSWDEDDSSLYETIRFAWPFKKEKAEQVEVILASYNRKIVGVFIADEWLATTPENFPDRKTAPGRIGFIGHEASPEIRNLYVGKRVSDELRSYGSSFRFINC